MRPLTKIALGLLLVLVGLFDAIFFTALVLIADCDVNCVAAHEQTVALLIALLGVGTATLGVVLAARGAREPRAR